MPLNHVLMFPITYNAQAQQKKKVETMADGELLSALKAALVNIKEARTSSDEDNGDEWD